jgi:cytochrome b
MARGEGGGAVWDLPVRIFHWTLLALVAVAWWSQENSDLNLHRIAGSSVVGLLVFRIWWGVFGSSTARFATFLKGPGAALAYGRTLLSRTYRSEAPGHNPLGGWSVLALIVCLVALVGFGLFAVDVDGLESGPLSTYVAFETGRLASKLHGMAFQVLEVLIALHVAAVAFYLVFKRQNLVGPMVTGRRRGADLGGAMVKGSPLMLVIGLALGAGATATLLRLSGVF